MDAIDIELPCSTQSRRSGEPIHGTAVAAVDAWLLIEQRSPWEADIADVELPQGVRHKLMKLATRHRRLRTQLIRRPDRSGELAVFVVTSGPDGSIARWNLPDHDALMDIDLERALRQPGPQPGATPEAPEALYLVCTHGRHDRCCGQRGAALFQAMNELKLGSQLWESSHQGGHRFAATVLYLPHGAQYGWLDPHDAEPLVHAHRRGQLYNLERYRGQSRYSSPMQSAEAWLRTQLDVMGLNGIRLLERRMYDDGRWCGRFVARNMLHNVTVAPRTGTVLRKSSCTAEQPTPAAWHDVVRYEAQTVE